MVNELKKYDQFRNNWSLNSMYMTSLYFLLPPFYPPLFFTTIHQYVLEVNTIPGMTKTSFIPAQCVATEISMKDLITILIENATIK